MNVQWMYTVSESVKEGAGAPGGLIFEVNSSRLSLRLPPAVLTHVGIVETDSTDTNAYIGFWNQNISKARLRQGSEDYLVTW